MTFQNKRSSAVSEWDKLQKINKPRILVGAGTCGKAAGAMDIIIAIKKQLTEKKIPAIITQVGCMGLCYAEPLVGIIKQGESQVLYGNLNIDLAIELVNDYIIGNNPRSDLALGYIGEKSVDGIQNILELPVLNTQVRQILRNCGIIDPENIHHYIANGGYSGLDKALKMSPEDIVEEIKKSGLRGRGGAGFSTGQKWEFCQKARGNEKYIICNADEGDPGAFMNRSLLEGDPHSVLEGMVIGAYTIGANHGYI
jgi:NADH-quinone oxidoreductase subunit F